MLHGPVDWLRSPKRTLQTVRQMTLGWMLTKATASALDQTAVSLWQTLFLGRSQLLRTGTSAFAVANYIRSLYICAQEIHVQSKNYCCMTLSN